MNDFMSLLTGQQNDRELAVTLERRRLLHEGLGADSRFRRNPSLWQRLQRRTHRKAPPTVAPRSALHANA